MKKTRDIKLYGEALPTWDSSDADLVIYADTQPTAVVLGFERYKKLVRLESIAEKRLMDDTEKTADISELDETTKECRHVYTDELKAENEKLKELIYDLRGYTRDWDWKYGAEWDKVMEELGIGSSTETVDEEGE